MPKISLKIFDLKNHSLQYRRLGTLFSLLVKLTQFKKENNNNKNTQLED